MILRMKRLLALLLLIELPGLAAAPKLKPPEQLVAEVIEVPGSFNQLCGIPALFDSALPLTLYGTIMPRLYHVSNDRMARLEKRRSEVVPALGRMIAAIRPDEPINKPPAAKNQGNGTLDGFRETPSGVSPRQPSGLLLELVEGLNAIETLPELLGLEDRLNAAMDRAEKDESIPPPSVDFDGFVRYYNAPYEPSPRKQELIKGRVVQREILSTMLELLRNQHFQPLLDSEFEQTYAKALKARAAEKDLRHIKTPEDARKEIEIELQYIQFDPIYHVPVGYMNPPPAVPYTPEVRKKARNLAADFIATVPRASWKTSPSK